MEEYPETIQSFVNALQKGMDYVQSHTPAEIAKAIEPQFPESDLETITTIVTRYYDQDTWKENLIFEKSSFEIVTNRVLQSLSVTFPSITICIFNVKVSCFPNYSYCTIYTSENPI